MFTSTAILFSILSVVRAVPLNLTTRGMYDVSGAHATVYYDLTNQLCSSSTGGPFTENWAVTSGINSGIPKCEHHAVGANAKSLAALGTNRIVAINGNMLDADLQGYCGKEVVIYDATGKKFEFSEGPLFIWDGCDACRSSPIVDLSAKAFTELKGGSCGGNNPDGLRFEVTNKNIWEPIGLDGSGGRGDAGSSGGGGSGSPPPAAQTTTTAAPTIATPTVVVPPANTPATTPATTEVAPTTQPTGSTSGNGNGNHHGSGSNGGSQAHGASLPQDNSNSKGGSPGGVLAVEAGEKVDNQEEEECEADDEEECEDEATAASGSSGSAPAPAVPATQNAGSGGSSTPAASGGNCTYGKYQCNGTGLEVCSYTSGTALGWINVAACASKCDISASGSVICQ